MQTTAEPTSANSPDRRAAWIMLFALGTAFSLSQAYRTVGAMMANQLQRDFALSAQQLGLFAGIFHFSFGGLQLVMGIGIVMALWAIVQPDLTSIVSDALQQLRG